MSAMFVQRVFRFLIDSKTGQFRGNIQYVACTFTIGSLIAGNFYAYLYVSMYFCINYTDIKMFTNIGITFPDIVSPGVVLFVIVVLPGLWILTRRPHDFPPGPPLLPFLGNVLSVQLDTRATFRKLRQQYGDIYSIYVFNQPIIVLNSYNVIRDALVKNADVFSDRPNSFISDHLLKGRGIVGTSGIVWREQRKFAVSTLREFGLGRPLLENRILEEINIFLNQLSRHNGEDMDCRPLVGSAVANIICSVVFGKRFEYDDISFRSVLQRMDENVASFGSASVLNVLPIVRYLPGDLFRFKRILSNLAFTEFTLVCPSIDEHMKDQNNEMPSDFISAYIKEMRPRQQRLKHTSMNVENLQSIILDIFGTGSETIATTIRWALVYFLNYPDVQEKCFQEIKENIGLNRPPSMKDKTNLPYLEATITETLRHANIVPSGVPHTVPRDIKFRGYTIPQGVMVLPVLDSVLHDPDVWGDPENFRPERFLDKKGNFVKRDEFIPFSMGRRVCLGESMSSMELFLFLAAMLQRFLLVCGEEGTPSLDADVGIVFSPKPFRMKIVPRRSS